MAAWAVGMLFRRRPEPTPAPPPPDPYVPWDEHDALRAAVDPVAEQDARRHAEDLLGRALPYTDQVAAQAGQRLERLGLRRAELLAAAELACDAATRRIERERAALAASTAALDAAGVPERFHALAPRRRPWRQRVLGAFGLRARDWWDGVDGLLDRQACALDGVAAAEAARAAAEARLTDVETQGLALARAEIVLARELVERYRAGLVHHLPPESLADGAAVAEQDVDVPRPAWLEDAAERAGSRA